MMQASEIKDFIDYDPLTGVMKWKPRGNPAWDARYAGTPALNTKCSNGYRKGSINNKSYYAHRVVFALTHGRWPNGDVDHIDRDRSNNNPENLREATRSQNLRNANPRGKTSKYLGVSYDSARGKWTARVRAGGKPRSLGRFASEVAAARAYDAAAITEYGEFANLNFGMGSSE